jgi:long-chain acyl-CoA synthetase
MLSEHYGMTGFADSPTISDYLAANVSRCPTDRALGYIRHGELQWLTWQQVADRAHALAKTLQLAGITTGDHVAQVSENRYEWVITDLALHLAGVVHVPIHVTLSAEQIAEQIIGSGSTLVFVSTQGLLGKFLKLLPPGLTYLIHDDLNYASQPPTPPGGLPPAPSIPHPASSSLATILYTSGTTGRPRGVMLSHANLATNASSLVDAFGDPRPETRLCILPLSHIYARTCDLYTWVYRGSQLVIAESRETLDRDLALVRPTALNAVPFLYQRIADRIRAATSEADQQAAAVRSFFGGQMEILNCGGAPLAPEVETWYAARGLPVLMGYGLTETSPVISASTPQHYRPGAVGRPLPDVEVRIAHDGEVLACGPNIMLGYWNDDAATREIMPDGWLHTGDVGELDANGYLFIRGRKKELIVLSTGKKVTPTRVELLLTASPLIDQAIVFGDGLCGLIALIVPAQPAPSTACGLAQPNDSEEQHALYTTELQRCLASAAREEQIHRFALVERPFSIERGEMTGKLSLCRAVIARNFATELQRLQQDTTRTRQTEPTL